MVIIHSDISYGGMNFLEIIKHVEYQNAEKYPEFFSHIIEGITTCQKMKFSELWSEGIVLHLQHSHLSIADKKELKQMGENLGNVDKEQQLALLQLYINKWDYRIAELEREKDGKKKLYRMLGALGSTFVAVIFL